MKWPFGSLTMFLWGKWVVKGYSLLATHLSDELISVTVKKINKSIEIEIENRKIRGSVETTKYDADYPEIFDGAGVAHYTDSNADREFDPETDKESNNSYRDYSWNTKSG